MQPYPISQDSFKYEMIKLYDLCGSAIRERYPDVYYENFGQKYTTDEVRAGFKRLTDAPPPKLNKYVIETSIKECLKSKKGVDEKIGCTYCDSLGCIDYWKEINGVKYHFSARCHKCRTSKYVNEPFYNEVFPNDDIQPHSTPEQMVCGKHIVEDVVKLITKREHEDPGQAQKRKRQMYREKTL